MSSPSPPATANGYSAASLGLHGACPRAGGGKGWRGRTASAHLCPLPGPQPRTPAGRAFADRSQVPAARAAVSPEPSPPAPPQTGPTKETQGRGAQRAPATRQTLPCGRKTSLHTRPDTHTPGARRGGHLLPVPAQLLIAPPHPPTHGGLAAPRPLVGPPAARSEQLHSLPGCARPAPAGPGGGGGGGDRDSGCSSGGGGGPSRRQSDWSREASSPVLVRRPGKPPGALLAGPPPPAAAARPEPLGEPARRGSAARPAATCAEARGGGASGTSRRGVSRAPGRRPRPPVGPDSPCPRLGPLGWAAGAPRVSLPETSCLPTWSPRPECRFQNSRCGTDKSVWKPPPPTSGSSRSVSGPRGWLFLAVCLLLALQE